MFTSMRFSLIKETIVDFEASLAHGSSEKFIFGVVEDLPMACDNMFLCRCLRYW